jgi:hypothetical protein
MKLRAFVERYKTWIPTITLIAIIAGIKFLFWWGAEPAARPKSMPVESVWIEAPTLPFSWHHGWWFGCWIDTDGKSDICQLWGSGMKDPVVFEGQYVSCEDHFPISTHELKLKAPPDSFQMWVSVSSGIAPAAFLQNGKHLVPVGSPHGCQQLIDNLKHP